MHDKTNHIFHWKDVKLEDMPIVAKEIIEKAADIRIFTLSGDLGAGKTTLVKEFCALLQVLDVVGSPTFSIVNEYRTRHAEAVYHFDLYRIKRLAELEEIGF
ncbi:MAG TPA: tRNA (adenosine(37)-N6)-threonylcarbamoyltransferase complex ATPase subunit type 1 TsaE, partial [Cyclobacteriaceae bacterium]|nr:tRNA (adenosine(37)-N6)-threonylcarbamoyltransferase complex ATPase subunit type 1 TsaE [Cyclobacteriaceae bacterium]